MIIRNKFLDRIFGERRGCGGEGTLEILQIGRRFVNSSRVSMRSGGYCR